MLSTCPCLIDQSRTTEDSLLVKDFEVYTLSELSEVLCQTHRTVVWTVSQHNFYKLREPVQSLEVREESTVQRTDR